MYVCTSTVCIYCRFILCLQVVDKEEEERKKQIKQNDDAQSQKEEAGANIFLLSVLMNRKELAITFWESENVSGVLVLSNAVFIYFC